MSLIAPTIPPPGDPAGVGVSEAQVSSALTTIVNAVNGGLDLVNLSSTLQAFVRPPFVTALPSSPQDQQEIFFVANNAAGVVWHLRYNNASSSPYKWESVGSQSALSSQSNSTGAVTSTAYGASLMSVTVPLAGDYEVVGGSLVDLFSTANGVQMLVALGVAGSPSDDNRVAQAASVANTSQSSYGSRPFSFTGVAASSTIGLHARLTSTSGGASGTHGYRSLFVRPRRVG